jgi:hypothetical protein
MEDLSELGWHQSLAVAVAETPMLVVVKRHPAGAATAADQMVHRLRA